MTNLFDTDPLPRGPQARAAANDPAPSHIAAMEVEASGVAGKQRELVLWMVQLHHDCTAAELAVVGPLNQFQIARRLPELANPDQPGGAKVVRGEPRKCRVNGTMMTTWRAKT